MIKPVLIVVLLQHKVRYIAVEARHPLLPVNAYELTGILVSSITPFCQIAARIRSDDEFKGERSRGL